MTELTQSELSIRETIRDLIAAYTHAGDGFRLTELADLFVPDGVLEVYGRETATGREAIVNMLSGHGDAGRPAEGRFYIRHFVANVLIDEITETSARAVSYFQVLTPGGADHWGRYRDTFAVHSGQWRFERRVARVDGIREGGWYEHVHGPLSY
jgi:hypothetical protein